jgi:hypothetical protein
VLKARELSDQLTGLVLVHDPEDLGQEWSLWAFESDRQRILVDWEGDVLEGEGQSFPLGWSEPLKSRGFAYLVTEQNAMAMIMAARHMTTEAWFRFCKRQVERQVEQMIDVVNIWQGHRALLMPAGELMYFHGAPLAHVVAYEEHHRLARIRKQVDQARRYCRRLA